jgi:hypothetical protein
MFLLDIVIVWVLVDAIVVGLCLTAQREDRAGHDRGYAPTLRHFRTESNLDGETLTLVRSAGHQRKGHRRQIAAITKPASQMWPHALDMRGVKTPTGDCFDGWPSSASGLPLEVTCSKSVW